MRALKNWIGMVKTVLHLYTSNGRVSKVLSILVKSVDAGLRARISHVKVTQDLLGHL